MIVVDARARRPGSSLYLVTTFAGEALAGNVTALPPGTLDNPGWTETVYKRLDEADAADHPEHHALVRVFQLPGGFRLLVGRDLDERERLYNIVLAAGRWSIAIVIVLGSRRRTLRHPPGPASRRCDDGDNTHDHAWRSGRTVAGRGHRR